MLWWEILIVFLTAAAFAAAIGYSIYCNVSGKGGCDCGGNCDGCRSKSCPHCESAKKSTKQK